MKLTIHRNTLLDHLSRVAKATGKDLNTSGMLVEASGTMLTLTATDTELTISATLQEIEIQRDGSTVLPAKAFLGAVQKLPAAQVNIELTGTQALIQCGKTKIKLSATEPEDFPRQKIEVGVACNIDVEALRTMFAQTAFAVAVNANTPVLCGVNLKLSDDGIVAVGCDRHRLAERRESVNCAASLAVVLPAKTITEIIALKGDGEVEVTASPSQVTLLHGDYRITSGVLGGTYPDTSRMFGLPEKSNVNVNAPDFAAAIDRAKVTTEKGTSIIRMQVTENEITVTSKDDSGNATQDSVDAKLTGEPITISCNAQFLLDALKRCGERAQIAFTGTMSPIVITDPRDDKSRFLVLPYRTSEG